MRRLLTVAVAVAALGLCGTGGTALAAFPGDNGYLAFVSDRDGNAEIYLLKSMPRYDLQSSDLPCQLFTLPGWPFPPTSLVQSRLTNHPGHDSAPAWSPRRRDARNADFVDIAFQSDRDGDSEIYALPANRPEGPGSAPAKLTDNVGIADTDPAWQPSQQIALEIIRQIGNSDPDPVRVAFVSDRAGNRDIFTMASDGTDVQRITRDPADDSEPVWSLDGTEIAFVSDRDGERALYATRADGSGGVRRISPDAAAPVRGPDWHAWVARPPFTERFAFAAPQLEPGAERIGWDVYGSDESGGPWTRLVDGAGDDANPVWAPQGDCLAFDGTRDGTRQIYVQLRTGEERKLTSEGNNWSPEWESLRNIDDSYYGAANPGSGGGISCTKSGKAGNDVLIGGPGNDVLCGKGGRDRLIGRGGNDVLVGGTGPDYLSGGPGNDRILAEDGGGRDVVSGGRGRDSAKFDRGRDRRRSIEVSS